MRRPFNVIYRSSGVTCILASVHRELKQAGVIIPGSRFDSIRKAYDDSPAWQRVTEILEEMDGDCAARGAEFIVLKFPEMNLLEAGRLFRGYDRAFEAFAAGHPRVHYVDGTRLFEGEASRDFVLHKYDGHPNAAAHGRIAERLARQISRPRG